MSDIKENLRFLLPSQEALKLAYRPSSYEEPRAQNATMGVKFAHNVYIIDPWGFILIGKTRFQRFIFRIKHPVIYLKRGFRKLYRRIRSMFIKDEQRKRVPLNGKEELG